MPPRRNLLPSMPQPSAAQAPASAAAAAAAPSPPPPVTPALRLLVRALGLKADAEGLLNAHDRAFWPDLLRADPALGAAYASPKQAFKA